MTSMRPQVASAPYRPTSLDFINLPNPIEPHAESQKHPLNHPTRAEKSRHENGSNQEIFQLIQEPPTKRQKFTENASLDLPRLPVRNATKRMRIPPTLSGLHQPPPDAGLLPSINVEQPQIPPLRRSDPPNGGASHTKEHEAEAPADEPRPEEKRAPSSTDPASSPQAKKSKRNKWTDDETAFLLKGVARFGIGNWTKILTCRDYQFNRRTATDLKDRFRVCCPDQYKGGKRAQPQPHQSETCAGTHEAITDPENLEATDSTQVTPKGSVPERLTATKLKKLGFVAPFTKTNRRSRHGYTPEEDEAILEGFRKYGNSWSSIQQDKSLGLARRRPTDLRDRFRTRYAEEYAKAGLAVRKVERSAETVKRTAECNKTGSEADPATLPAPTGPKIPQNASTSQPPLDAVSRSEAVLSSLAAAPRKPPQPSLFALDDFLDSTPFDPDADFTHEPIVLDRGILDWAAHDAVPAAPPELARSNGINPLMTLKLPEPVSSKQPLSSLTSSQPPLPASTNTTTSLPSLAALMPTTNSSQEQFEQLELPSLMQFIGSLDVDGRGANTIPTLDELLS